MYAMNAAFGPTTRTLPSSSLFRIRIDGAMKGNCGLAGARPALDDEDTFGRRLDQPVLVGDDRCDDRLHVRLTCALELLRDAVEDRTAGTRWHLRRSARVAEVLVADVSELAFEEIESPAALETERIILVRRVEGLCDRAREVDDLDLCSAFTVHGPT